MEDERELRGAPVLHRQRGPVRDNAGQPLHAPSRVPETRPTPLQGAFIHLSIVVLVCGAVAISALELGVHPREPIVRVPVLVGGAVLAVVAADAMVRIWRSAWAWLPVDRGRGMFRFVW
ncbi:MAG: hypothetical protein M3301_01055, partial [Chloroflexota bacterium]|nr:hypothetical protein [Chloroflexota bacterium]